MASYSPACNIADKGMVWVAYNRGGMVTRSDGNPVIAPAWQVAAMERNQAARRRV